MLPRGNCTWTNPINRLIIQKEGVTFGSADSNEAFRRNSTAISVNRHLKARLHEGKIGYGKNGADHLI